jgi:hypothetical protein
VSDAAHFAGVVAELEELGLRHGSDFRVQGVALSGLPGSEYVGLRLLPDGSFEVSIEAMGRYRREHGERESE